LNAFTILEGEGDSSGKRNPRAPNVAVETTRSCRLTLEWYEMFAKYVISLRKFKLEGQLCFVVEVNIMHIQRLQDLIQNGADVNDKDYDGTSLLHVAARNNFTGIAEILLEFGSLLYCTLTSSLKRGYKPFHVAAENDNTKTVAFLLNRRANVDVKAEKSYNEIVPTTLHCGVMSNRTEIVEMVLYRGARIDAKNQCGETPLYNSIENKNITVLLLVGGDSADSKGEDGVNPLHIAAKNRNIAKNETATGLLLHHGAKVDNQDKYGKTALHFAIEAENLTAV
ncbi:ankyrin-1-like, partial [Artemia franciscana]|uniref:ankyrin-1-like n=1 Tax=Artemia franciscana TaxID=6661 RepID=UPI0032DA0815